MIPEELEKRVQEAKKEVRGPGEGGRGNVRVSGPEGEDAEWPGPPVCRGGRRSSQGGRRELICRAAGSGACSKCSVELLECAHSQGAGAC